MLMYHFLYRFQHKIHLQRLAQHIGKDLLRASVQDRGEVAERAVQRNIGDIRQQDASRSVHLKLPLHKVFPPCCSSGSPSASAGTDLPCGLDRQDRISSSAAGSSFRSSGRRYAAAAYGCRARLWRNHETGKPPESAGNPPHPVPPARLASARRKATHNSRNEKHPRSHTARIL